MAFLTCSNGVLFGAVIWGWVCVFYALFHFLFYEWNGGFKISVSTRTICQQYFKINDLARNLNVNCGSNRQDLQPIWKCFVPLLGLVYLCTITPGNIFFYGCAIVYTTLSLRRYGTVKNIRLQLWWCYFFQ